MEGAANLTKLLRQIQSVGYLAYPGDYFKWSNKSGTQLTLILKRIRPFKVIPLVKTYLRI